MARLGYDFKEDVDVLPEKLQTLTLGGSQSLKLLKRLESHSCLE